MSDDESTKIWNSDEFFKSDRNESGRQEEGTTYFGNTGTGDGEKTEIISKPQRKNLLAWLVVFKGKKSLAKFDLEADDYLIGRANYCDIRLDDEDQELSRLHGRIRYDDETREFIYFDCGSANGSRINDEDSARKILKDNDRINVGPYDLIFKRV
jgi:hypothetical protein